MTPTVMLRGYHWRSALQPSLGYNALERKEHVRCHDMAFLREEVMVGGLKVVLVCLVRSPRREYEEVYYCTLPCCEIHRARPQLSSFEI